MQQYIAFCVWLISVNIIFQDSSVFYNVLVLHSFLWLNSIPLYGDTTFNLSIHGHLGCSQFLASMNNLPAFFPRTLLSQEHYFLYITPSFFKFLVTPYCLFNTVESIQFLTKVLTKCGLKLLFFFIVLFLTISKICASYE